MQSLIFRCLVIVCLSVMIVQGQTPTDTLRAAAPLLEVSGFMDVFYGYDFNEPKEAYRQTFLSNHNRHNAFHLNNGFLKAAVIHERYRANLAFHSGTYVQDNYAAEPDILRTIYEANVGIALDKKSKLWLDAGVFASHIGFESAVSIENLTLTRSILAENSPYYLSGAKLTYLPNSKWELAALICNGWQRIQKVSGNSLPSFGTQVKYSPSDKMILNWSTFIGTHDPDVTRRMRYFSNLYGQFKFSSRLQFIAGFDFGVQELHPFSHHYTNWYSPVLIGQMRLSKKWKTALRAEYYQDISGVIIRTTNVKGFRVAGFSLNLDYAPAENFLWRIEGRWMNSPDKLFEQKNKLVTTNIFLCTSLALRFKHRASHY